MRLLIDGYNLLHASGILGRRLGASSLADARQVLLETLGVWLTEAERMESTIVFDAKNAPAILPHREVYREMQIIFAKEFDEADDLIESLIRQESNPKKVLVVSSDRRLQRAAKRRKAPFIGSERWYEELQSRHVDGVEQRRPESPLTNPQDVMAESTKEWLDVFSDIDIAELDLNPEQATQAESTPACSESADPQAGSGSRRESDESAEDRLDEGTMRPPKSDAASDFTPDVTEQTQKLLDDDLLNDPSLANPFPPGYAEDMLDEESDR